MTEFIEVVPEQLPSNLNYSELLRGNGCKKLEVLLSLAPTANIADGLGRDLAGAIWGAGTEVRGVAVPAGGRGKALCELEARAAAAPDDRNPTR